MGVWYITTLILVCIIVFSFCYSYLNNSTNDFLVTVFLSSILLLFVMLIFGVGVTKTQSVTYENPISVNFVEDVNKLIVVDKLGNVYTKEETRFYLNKDSLKIKIENFENVYGMDGSCRDVVTQDDIKVESEKNQNE